MDNCYRHIPNEYGFQAEGTQRRYMNATRKQITVRLALTYAAKQAEEQLIIDYGCLKVKGPKSSKGVEAKLIVMVSTIVALTQLNLPRE